MRARLPVIALAALALIAPAVPAVAGTPSPSPLVFGTCPEDITEFYPALTCATLQVPVDYRQPTGATIPLLVTKRSANNPAKRLGSLVVNPGGPGGSGVIAAGYVSTPDETGFTPLQPAVLDAYDVVGFDPRGVRHSGAISCAAPDYFPVPQPDPDARASRDALSKLWDGYADGCSDKAGALLPHLGTENVARDMDRVRAALGEQKLLLPRLLVRHLSRRGVHRTVPAPGRPDDPGRQRRPHPRDLFYKMAMSQSLAFPKRLDSYLSWVAKYDAVFHLGATVSAVRANWNKTLTDFRTKPHGAVGGHELLGTAFGVLTSEEAWTAFAQALSTYVVDGDDTALVDFATPNTSAQAERFTASFSAVICGDSKWSHRKATYERDAARIAKVSQAAWDNMWVTGSVCRNWPVPDRTPIKITGRRSPRHSDVQHGRRPGHAVRRSSEARKVLRSSVLVTERDSGAHCVFANPQSMVNTAANDIGTKYLLTGELPPRDVSVPGHALPVPTPAALKASTAKSPTVGVRWNIS